MSRNKEGAAKAAPSSISVLIPTRERPAIIRQAIESAFATAKHPEAIEFRLWLEEDDPTRQEVTDWIGSYRYGGRVAVIVSDQRPLGQRWTDLSQIAPGDLFLLCADHVVFRTEGWDDAYRAEFEACEDKILVVHANDGFQKGDLATLACVHRRWIEILGYFTPVQFRCWYFDTWITEIADMLGRRKYLPNVFIETLSPEAGNREPDEVFKRKRAWLEEYHEPELFAETRLERIAAAQKLSHLMKRPDDATISACLIVRNEAEHLAPCLDSIAGKVDEIVVVDTGSTDGTQEIARQYGAKVIEIPWPDSFAEARNVSLDAASGGWILHIDADEVMIEKDRSLRDIVAGIDREQVDGLVMLLMNFGEDGTVINSCKQARVFRNDPGLRFQFRIHENLVWADGHEFRVGEQPWVRLLHTGYMRQSADQQAKKERNMRLLHMQLEETPDDPFAMYCLAKELHNRAADEQERRDAAELFDKAISIVSQFDVVRGYTSNLYAQAIQARLHLKQFQKAIDVALLVPENVLTPEICFLHGVGLMERAKELRDKGLLLDMAERHLMRAWMDKDIQMNAYESDPSVVGWRAFMALGHLWAAKENWVRAHGFAVKAIVANPNEPQLRGLLIETAAQLLGPLEQQEAALVRSVA